MADDIEVLNVPVYEMSTPVLVVLSDGRAIAVYPPDGSSELEFLKAQLRNNALPGVTAFVVGSWFYTRLARETGTEKPPDPDEAHRRLEIIKRRADNLKKGDN